MRRPVTDVLLTLLFAVISAVSAVALVRTVASPFQDGSFGVAQWALFVVTVAGATFAFARSVRYWASLSLLARLRPPGSDGATEPSESASPDRRMHPILDDLTWGALAVAVVVINVFAVWAVVVTVGDLFGDSETAAGWLLWQLALLTAAGAALARLGGAVAAELRDRSLRRRRNAVHVVTGKLMNSAGESSSAGRRAQQVAAVAATAVLALVSLASASGPLLEPAQDPDSTAQLAKRIGEGRGAAPRSQGTGAAARTAGPPAQAAAVPGASESARKGSRRARASQRSSAGRVDADDQPTVAPVPPAASPPRVVTPAPTDPPADTTRPTPRGKERAADKRRRHQAEERRRGARKRRQQADERRRSAPTPPPPAATPPAPTTPTPSPPVTPCDPLGDPALQPPCGEWQGGQPPQ